MESFFNTIKTVPLNHYIILCSIIFSIGVMGVLIRRNAIVIFMSIELMLNSVNLLLTAFSVYKGDASGQVFVFFVMALAAAEVAVGLAIIVMIYRNTNSVDTNVLNRLKWEPPNLRWLAEEFGEQKNIQINLYSPFRGLGGK
jgi:NADH-quinone oxidoreductase subunit K